MPSPSSGARVARPRRHLFLSMYAVALLGAASCGSEPTTPDDELQALLHDEPLTEVMAGALSTDGGAGGGTGTDSGMGPGAGGMIITGKGGTTGAAGTGRGMGGTIGAGGSVGTAGMRGDGGMPPPPPSFGRLGEWTFDDCNEFRTTLFDSSFQDNRAFRSVSVACAEGISRQAVALAVKEEDIVYVPDQPNFTFSGGVTVAGWFNHTAVSNTRTLFRKRDDTSSSAFALVLNNQKYEFVVNLGSKAFSVISPKKATLNTWTHVAA